MSLELSSIEEQLKALYSQREAAQKAFYEIGGAIQVLELQVKQLKEPEEELDVNEVEVE